MHTHNSGTLRPRITEEMSLPQYFKAQIISSSTKIHTHAHLHKTLSNLLRQTSPLSPPTSPIIPHGKPKCHYPLIIYPSLLTLTPNPTSGLHPVTRLSQTTKKQTGKNSQKK